MVIKVYLFSFQMMYKYQFKKTDPYDWFCGPGSQLNMSPASKGLSLHCRIKHVSAPRTASTATEQRSSSVPNEPPTYSPAYLCLLHLNDNLQALGKCLTINYTKQHTRVKNTVRSLPYQHTATIHSVPFFSSPGSNPFKMTAGAGN